MIAKLTCYCLLTAVGERSSATSFVKDAATALLEIKGMIAESEDVDYSMQPSSNSLPFQFAPSLSTTSSSSRINRDSIMSLVGNASGLKYPTGIAVDARAGRIYICDSGNHRVVVTDLEGTYIESIGSGLPVSTKFLFEICREFLSLPLFYLKADLFT